MDRQEGVHHWSGSMTKILGGHNIKVGGEHRFNFLDYAQPGYPSGRFNFARSVTCQIASPAPANRATASPPCCSAGRTGSEFQIEPKAFSRSAYWGFYFQDDWKITPKLTLNLGLRYDFDVPRWEAQNRYSYWDLDAQSPVQVPGYDTKRRHQIH